MPRRKIERDTSVGQVLVHRTQTEMHQALDPSHWHLPAKHRNGHTDQMKGKEVFSEGFPGFFAVDEKVEHFGESIRKHFPHLHDSQKNWKPCFTKSKPISNNVHLRGKRFDHDKCGNQSIEEVYDVARGRQHVQPIMGGAIGAEMDVFQTKHQVVDGNGKPCARRMGPDGQARFPECIGLGGKHLTSGGRNGVPQTTPCDKNYTAVELSSEYLGLVNPTAPRLGVERVAAKFLREDKFGDKEKVTARQQEKRDVEHLPPYGNDDGD